MEPEECRYGETTVRAVAARNDFAYHRIEIEAEHEYTIDLWTDGAPAAGGIADTITEPSRNGYDVDMTTDGEMEDRRVRIGAGRSSTTSHYGDLREMDERLLEETNDVVTTYMEQAGEPVETIEAVGRFVEDIDAILD